MADDIPLTKRSVQIESKEVKGHDWNEQTFFPFQEDHERHEIKIDKHAAAFPMLGFGALIGALSLIALAGGILLTVQGPGKVVSDWTVHVYKTHRYVTIPKPAAWLSGILSGISVCFHIALSEGLNIAWWYHVRQENATVRDLHDVWQHGTSTWTVMKSGAKDFKNGVLGLGRKVAKRDAQEKPYSQRKHFSYVALATLFVATIPLNGFLLQNAVVVHAVTATDSIDITAPIFNGDQFGNVNSLILGLPDAQGSDGGIESWSSGLGQISQSVTTKTTASVDLGTYNTTCQDTCKTTILGSGFDINCTQEKQPYSILDDTQLYNLLVTNAGANETAVDKEMSTNGTDVFSIAITYNQVKWDRLTVRISYKDSTACTGQYSVSTCNLDLATVQYPVIINTGLKEATQDGLRDTTLMTLDMNLMTDLPKISKTLQTGPLMLTDGSYPMAGVAGLFGQVFNSSVNLRYLIQPYQLTHLTVDGLWAQQQLASQTIPVDSNTSPGGCSIAFKNSTQRVLATMQSMMFQLSSYEAMATHGNAEAAANFDPPYQPPTVSAVQHFQQNRYRIVWPWFFGAMTVTMVVAACITPTFWGYWRLERKTTMSPFETARAFHAPMLYQEDSTVKSEDLMKRVGDVQIHRDLPVVPVPSGSGARPGRTW